MGPGHDNICFSECMVFCTSEPSQAKLYVNFCMNSICCRFLLPGGAEPSAAAASKRERDTSAAAAAAMTPAGKPPAPKRGKANGTTPAAMKPKGRATAATAGVAVGGVGGASGAGGRGAAAGGKGGKGAGAKGKVKGATSRRSRRVEESESEDDDEGECDQEEEEEEEGMEDDDVAGGLLHLGCFGAGRCGGECSMLSKAVREESRKPFTFCMADARAWAQCCAGLSTAAIDSSCFTCVVRTVLQGCTCGGRKSNAHMCAQAMMCPTCLPKPIGCGA